MKDRARLEGLAQAGRNRGDMTSEGHVGSRPEKQHPGEDGRLPGKTAVAHSTVLILTY